jgi:phage terminase large subunit-like protein
MNPTDPAVVGGEWTLERVLEYKYIQHPVIPNPSREFLRKAVEIRGADVVGKQLLDRDLRIQLEQDDPFRYCIEPDHWKAADAFLDETDEVLVLGGNRAGKTEWAARRVAQMLTGVERGEFPWPQWMKDRCQKRGLKIWCLHTTNQSSIAFQQQVVYKYMPKELRNARKSKFTNLSYTQKNGFSENTAVYNTNQVWFLNYAQDKQVIEGGEPDLIWCDELVPHDWLETLRYRLVTRQGKLILTFTPILGYTLVVKEYLAGSKIVETKESPLLPANNVPGCPVGHMPFRATARQGRSGVVWFHTQLNPYSSWEQMQKTLKGRSSYDVKIRAYGWAESTAGSQFPNFGEHSIVPHDKIPVEGTNYMVVDPAGARNWFMLWCRVDPNGRLYIYREFPDESYGEWALPCDRPDGKPGPAQRSGAGKGIADYCQLIFDLEGEEEIQDRFIDPKAAGTPTASKEGGVTLLDLLEESGISFTPAATVTVDERVLLINDLLSYNKDVEISDENSPRLFVSERCQNLIYSLREWTGTDGQKGASKDPIDCLGYMTVMNPEFVEAKNMVWKDSGVIGSY